LKLIKEKGVAVNSKKLSLDSSNYLIPVSVLCDRNISLFETMVEYLKEIKGLTYHEIAVLTNRDDRTIWTVYNRAKKKRNRLGVVLK
jgi:uncharacterized protein (UPF0371 family)